MSTSPIVLYHYPISVYAKKVEWALAIKGLAYHSVVVKTTLPRPEVDIVAHGYRRIPVMMIGRDVYCDTRRILDALEEHFPTPSIYPPRINGKIDRGVVDSMSFWTDGKLVPIIAMLIQWDSPPFNDPTFRADRESLMNVTIDAAKIASLTPIFKPQLAIHAQIAERQLADGRQWFLDTVTPGAADIHLAMCLWFCEKLKPAGGAPEVWNKETCPKTFEWFERFIKYVEEKEKAIKCSGGEAVAIANEAEALKPLGAGEVEGFMIGQSVMVTPDDTGKVPTKGRLVRLDQSEVVVRPVVEADGLEVDVHFPRLGFVIVGETTNAV